jgi:hypothetical protein
MYNELTGERLVIRESEANSILVSHMDFPPPDLNLNEERKDS